MKLFTFELIAVLTIGITTFFAFAEAIEERPDAYPEWGADVYSSTDNAIARVVDPFMNADSNKIETLTVDIYTERNEDSPELKVTLTETNADTGIFEETIFLPKK